MTPLNDHTDAEFERRALAYELDDEDAGDQAWNRFYDEAQREIISRGWGEKFTAGRAVGKSRGLDGSDNENGYSIDGAYDAFRHGKTVAAYIAQVAVARAKLADQVSA